MPAYTLDATVLKVTCMGRRFLSPWRKFPTIPELFPAIFFIPQLGPARDGKLPILFFYGVSMQKSFGPQITKEQG